MPLYFVIFLGMLVASMLLYIVAFGFMAATRRPTPILIRGAASTRLQGANVALMWWSVGVGWLLYFNVYRIHVDMSALGDAALRPALSVTYPVFAACTLSGSLDPTLLPS